MLDIVVILFMGTGLVFFLATTIGVLRLPDFYSRMHAAGKGDVFSSLLMIIGAALYVLHNPTLEMVLTSLKIIAISVFIFLASPTATHAIIDAGHQAGILPWSKKGPKEGDAA